jgi:hypothetical protein
MGVDVASIPFPNVAGKEATRQAAAAGSLQAQRGRELARLQLEEMIDKIRRRALASALNRGLSLSLPYFDDGSGEMCWREILIIPRGRCLFVPAFVVLAARAEAERVNKDTCLTISTKAHLLELLHTLEEAFSPPSTTE